MRQLEEELIQQLKLGEEGAYKSLFDRHYQVLCHYASRIVKDDFLAESLVSDVIFHLWERRQSLHISTSLRSYLMASVRNCCLDYLRTQKRMSQTDIDQIAKNLTNEESPLGIILEKELEKQLAKSISSLPEKTKQVFMLSRFSGKGYDEISTILGISTNTVKYHMKQALSILRDSISKYIISGLVMFFLGF